SACKRGMTVSALESSELRITTSAGSARISPPHTGLPVVMPAHRSRVRSDLPISGLPSRMDNLPRANRPSDSQDTGLGASWLMVRKDIGIRSQESGIRGQKSEGQ